MKDSTGDDVREGVRVSAADEVELPGSRGSAHFALKWVRDARHPAHLTLAPVKGVTRAYTAADDGKWVGVVGMECRGLEPVSWQPEVRPLLLGTLWRAKVRVLGFNRHGVPRPGASELAAGGAASAARQLVEGHGKRLHQIRHTAGSPVRTRHMQVGRCSKLPAWARQPGVLCRVARDVIRFLGHACMKLYTVP